MLHNLKFLNQFYNLMNLFILIMEEILIILIIILNQLIIYVLDIILKSKMKKIYIYYNSNNRKIY